jgi:3-deoxy-D-manno-octulosonic-acid transferase
MLYPSSAPAALYSLLWKAARPFLRARKRLREGFAERLVPPGWPFTPSMQAQRDGAPPGAEQSPSCRLWIQAASGGEAYLARELLKLLASRSKLQVLCTSCTRQGLDILREAQKELDGKNIGLTVNYLPLDEPGLMRKAVERAFGPAAARPGKTALVLLETEIWPGLLDACQRAGVSVLFVNARMSEGSRRGYGIIKSLFRMAPPRGILATSREDLRRFCRVFDGLAGAKPGYCRGVMPNIKFDRLHSCLPQSPRRTAEDPGGPSGLIALGSVREEEEELLLPLIPQLARFPLIVAPRHMHRVEHWTEKLRRNGYDVVKRSACGRIEQIEHRPGRIVVWDVFGELPAVYALASAVFVGGSLAPLGGQNFLEPLACGVSPCIGPFWSNFYWAGRELFDSGLVTRVQNAGELAGALLRNARNPGPKSEVERRFRQYLLPRLGGAKQAVELIMACFSEEMA